MSAFVPFAANAQDADTPPRWRLDAGYAQSRLARADRQNWHEEYLALRRSLDDGTSVNGRVDVSRRYAQTDVSVGGGFDHRFSRDFGVALNAYVTPDADFLARWAVQGDLDGKIWGGGDILGPTIATLTVRHKDYAAGDSDNIDPGIVQYLSGGHWLTVKWINTFERGPGKRLGGYFLRGDLQVQGDLRLFAGYAFAPETDDSTVVHVRSRFAGVVYDVNDRTALRLDYAGEDRKGSYLRNTVTFGITRRF